MISGRAVGRGPGYAVYPAIDIVLRIVYGTACLLLFKTLSDVICRRTRPPGWATYLFVPYVIQVPVVTVATAFATTLFNRSLQVSMQPIFASFEEALAYLLTIFVLSMAASFYVAWFLRRFEIRV